MLPPANYVEFYNQVSKIVKDQSLPSFEARSKILKLVRILLSLMKQLVRKRNIQLMLHLNY